jgi:hypothetical protein
VAPAPAPADVELLVEGSPEPFAVITVQTQQTSGSAQIQLSPNAPNETFEIIARSGSSQVSATLTIEG